jgi:hypothetical protein
VRVRAMLSPAAVAVCCSACRPAAATSPTHRYVIRPAMMRNRPRMLKGDAGWLLGMAGMANTRLAICARGEPAVGCAKW